MAGYQVALPIHFRTPTAWLTSGSMDDDFPATNLGLYDKPWRGAKSQTNVVSGTTYFGANFGAAVSMTAVAIDNINISSIKIQASNTVDFAVVLDSGALTVGENAVEALPHYPAGGRRKYLFFTAGTPIGANARQYWRVLANTSTRIPGWDSATDGGTPGKLYMGSLLWLSSIMTLAAGTSEYSEQPLEATATNENFAGGGSEPVILGNPYAAITLGAAPAKRSDMRADVLKVLRHGVGRWFLFNKNNGDTADWYIARRAVDVMMRQTAPDLISFESFTLQTAV